MKKAILIILFLSLLQGSNSQNIILDNTFDSDGIVLTDFTTNDDIAKSICIQPDGKILIAGIGNDGATDNVSIARYNTNGSLDLTFGINGKVSTSINNNKLSANSVNLQSDGKILVAGSIYYDIFDINTLILRYNTDGTLDNTFDGDGILISNFHSGVDEAMAMVVLNNDDFVIAGYVSGSNADVLVAKYNSTGDLDLTFDNDGFATTSIGSSHDYAFSVGVQLDGKILVSGYSSISSVYNMTVLRYNINGTLDSTFDNDGKATISFGSIESRANSIKIQSDQKIIIGGYAGSGNNRDFAVARLNTDGTLDNLFDTDGKTITSIGNFGDNGQSLAIQNNSKIILSGYSYNGSINNFALVRYNADGTIDNSFDQDGILTQAIGQGNNQALSSAIDNNGRILTCGVSTNGTDDVFAVARFTEESISLNEYSEIELVELYPNPAKEFIVIKSKNDVILDEIRIFDLLGNIISRKKTQTKITIQSLEGINPGLYYIELLYNNKSSIVKIAHY